MELVETPKWSAIKYYLSIGLSIIPVREREEMFNGRVYPPKTPIGRWAIFQRQQMVEGEAWEKIMCNDLAQPAIVAGMVSGNLEIIDIDEKHWNGISINYLTTIQKLRPDIFNILRIHKTPSGGYHILYRCEELLKDGNQKLAVKAGSKEAGIETRGEGGYIVAPPAMGYEVTQNLAIPVLSLADRDFLINTAKCYDERIVLKPSYKPSKKDESFYDENPFADFDNSITGQEILLSFGWSQYNETGEFIQYTRPGKNTGVSASFIKDKRVFYIFTSSTNLEPNKAYKPGTLLALLKFNGDFKAANIHLIESGYGKIKKDIEKRLVKSTAQKGGQLPANISQEGRANFEKASAELSEKYPYGIFWEGDFLQGFTISRERLYSVAAALGFRIYSDQVCFIDGFKIHKVHDRYFFDVIKGYIKEEHPKEQENVCNAYETFIQRSGKFTIGRLPVLNTLLIIKSTKYASYKFFSNCFVQITKDGIKQRDYAKIGDNLIWAEQIKERPFVLLKHDRISTGAYYEFLEKAIGIEANNRHLLKCIGYLTHDFKDEEMGYITILTEMVPNPKDGGGSGKNIFCTMLGHSTSLKEVPGTQVQMNEKLMQTWNGERVFALSDVSKRFEYSFLKNLSTNNAVVKKLFKDEVTVSSEEMPKFVVSTNFSYEVSDGGLRRRIIPIEFSDFFTKSGGVKKHFGKMFPSDFTTEDWQSYDNLIAWSIYEWLNVLELLPPELTASGWLKQFDINYGESTRHFIEENWDNWMQVHKISIKDFNVRYDAFLHENGISQKYKLSAIRMNAALSDWCKRNGIAHDGNRNIKTNGISEKYKTFSEPAPF